MRSVVFVLQEQRRFRKSEFNVELYVNHLRNLVWIHILGRRDKISRCDSNNVCVPSNILCEYGLVFSQNKKSK